MKTFKQFLSESPKYDNQVTISIDEYNTFKIENKDFIYYSALNAFKKDIKLTEPLKTEVNSGTLIFLKDKTPKVKVKFSDSKIIIDIPEYEEDPADQVIIKGNFKSLIDDLFKKPFETGTEYSKKFTNVTVSTKFDNNINEANTDKLTLDSLTPKMQKLLKDLKIPKLKEIFAYKDAIVVEFDLTFLKLRESDIKILHDSKIVDDITFSHQYISITLRK